MRIPKRFNLMGHTVEVEYDSKLTHAHDATGEAHYRFNKIILQGQEGYDGRPLSKVEQDFCHELVHFILYFGECADTKELWKNEMVVDRISCLIHQALTTMQYDDGGTP